MQTIWCIGQIRIITRICAVFPMRFVMIRLWETHHMNISVEMFEYVPENYMRKNWLATIFKFYIVHTNESFRIIKIAFKLHFNISKENFYSTNLI